MREAERLKEAGEEAVKRFTPDGEASYANLGFSYVAKKMGHRGFDGMQASQIVVRVRSDPDWSNVTPEAAQKLANDGKLVLAGFQDEVLGHVAAVMPGNALRASKWNGELAPIVANVGVRNGIMGANHAFSSRPQYWVWI